MRRFPAAKERPESRGQGQSDADALRAFDDVRVGHDVSGGIDDDSGTYGVLAHDERRLRAAFFMQRPVAGHEDLNDRGGHLGGEVFQSVVELSQGLR